MVAGPDWPFCITADFKTSLIVSLSMMLSSSFASIVVVFVVVVVRFTDSSTCDPSSCSLNAASYATSKSSACKSSSSLNDVVFDFSPQIVFWIDREKLNLS